MKHSMSIHGQFRQTLTHFLIKHLLRIENECSCHHPDATRCEHYSSTFDCCLQKHIPCSYRQKGENTQ